MVPDPHLNPPLPLHCRVLYVHDMFPFLSHTGNFLDIQVDHNFRQRSENAPAFKQIISAKKMKRRSGKFDTGGACGDWCYC